MSIYIQIATIEDYSVSDTVMSAITNAKNPDDVYIGIAATVSQDFYDKVVEPLSKISNVSVKKFNPKTDRGLGKGRINSRFAYNDQDYVLQIDAHTLFQKDWDDTLINIFSNALKETNNSKTLVTGYLGRYAVSNGSPYVISDMPGYSVWPEKNVYDGVNLRSVALTCIADFPDWVLDDKTKPFYPSNRVAGNFIFGNKEWAKFQGWSGDEVFWEEEILPAITLLYNGFSLVFPNMPLPLTHRYWDDDLQRQVMDDIFDEGRQIDESANNYIQRFAEENKDACEKYCDYAGYDLKTNSLTYKVFVPASYAMS